MSLTTVFWLAFAATVLAAAKGWTRSEAQTVIVLGLAALAIGGLIA